MPENTEPTNAGKPEDEAVLELQNLENAEGDAAEVEAHGGSTFSVWGCYKEA